ncbi:MAG: alpha-L-fucosidase [Niabella sp.]
MKKKPLFLLFVLFAATAIAQPQPTSEKRMQWWQDARLGMFVHWGTSSVLGGEWNGKDYGKEMGDASAEWIYLTADIPQKEYETMAKSFDPVNYRPEEWVKLAKDAGMKYMVLTAKHHDGFALFNTKYSPWNYAQVSNTGRDLLKEYIDACHRQHMKVGLYFSHEKDWYHSKKVRNNPGEISETYVQLVKNQLTELLINYGKIDLIWFDMGIAAHRSLNEMCYKLVRNYQPDCIISGRIGSGLGDYKNLGDRELAPPGIEGYVETIMTMRLNWGYDKNDMNWKSTKDVVTMISKAACRNSNFLLNVGPQPNGNFTPEEKVRLKNIGLWMQKNGEAIYKTKGSPFKGEFEWGSLTYNDKNIYLHLNQLLTPKIICKGIVSTVKKISLLSTGEVIPFIQNKKTQTTEITLPERILQMEVPVLLVELNNKPVFNISKGPVKLPPAEKHLTSKSVTGVVEKVGNTFFTIKTNDNKLLQFEQNETIEYRMNTKGDIRTVAGFDLKAGQSCTIVYEPQQIPVVKIIELAY